MSTPKLRLEGTLADTPQLDLLRTPYYLRMLVGQTEAGEIPAGRAGLFTGFVRQALKREVGAENPLFQDNALLAERDVVRLARGRWRDIYELPRRGALFGKLSALAYDMQRQHSSSDAAQVRIPRDDALGLLNHERDEEILAAGVALGVLDEDPGPEDVLYVHQLMQEYFAARQLAAKPDIAIA